MKRRKFFRCLKDKGCDISLIQETHCAKSEHLWRSEWGNKCIFSNGTQAARGVAIMFSHKTAKHVRDII